MGKDYVGRRYGRLVVESTHYENKSGRRRLMCDCVCDCENTKSVMAYLLDNHRTKSCGCYARELASKRLKSINEYIFHEYYVIGQTRSGYEFLIDIDDYDKIKDYCWHRHKDGYLRTRIGLKDDGRNQYMLQHMLICGVLEDGLYYDHINGNPNDNRKENLRVVSHSQNMKNQKLNSENKTGKNGVTRYKNGYRAKITFNGQQKYLGYFDKLDDAIEARVKAEEEFFGVFTRK